MYRSSPWIARAPANDDPAHPVPMSRERQIELMQGAVVRREEVSCQVAASPAFYALVKRAAAARAQGQRPE